VAEQAEEVATPTDPKTLAKIAVTEAIRNATMNKDFNGNNFVIKGKTYTFQDRWRQCARSPILLPQERYLNG
jgi:hypothetical protein